MSCPGNTTLELSVCVGDTDPTVEVSVIVADGIPPEIFIFQQTTQQDALGCYIKEFCAVANCSQMTDYPADEPRIGFPFFRLSSVDMTFDHFGEVQDFLDTLCADVDKLLDCWDKKVLFTETKFIVSFPRG